jgi:enamine deaminase RidA (YjgF/YER057c/UK114 family)
MSLPAMNVVRTGLSKDRPHPATARVRGLVFTSSIYPIGQDGRPVLPDPLMGETGPSAIQLQARRCIELLEKELAAAGASLSGVVKADIHLARAADFYEFKLVWQEFFPKEPPACTVIEVGKTFPWPDVLLNLDAVAIAHDSGIERKVLNDPRAPSHVEAEWASHAVQAGELIFCSGFTASDFTSGLGASRPPGFPYYGSEATMQADYVFERMNRVLGQVGASIADTLESQMYEPDLRTFHDVDTVWGRYMPVPPARSSICIKGLTVPGAHFIPNFVVLSPGAGFAKEDPRAGLAWHPEERKVNFSPTIKAGPWRFFAGQVASQDFKTTVTSPAALPNHFSAIEVQTRFVLDLLTKQLQANETDWSHCFHCRVFLIEPERNYRGFIRAWQRHFSNTELAPPLSYVPALGTPFPGPIVEIDPSCIAKS